MTSDASTITSDWSTLAGQGRHIIGGRGEDHADMEGWGYWWTLWRPGNTRGEEVL